MPGPHEATPAQEAIGLATQSALTQIATSTRPSSFPTRTTHPSPPSWTNAFTVASAFPHGSHLCSSLGRRDGLRRGGRIWLMRKAATGEAPLDNIFQTHIDNSLGCKACMTACPSGVEYNKLYLKTHAVRSSARPNAAVRARSQTASSANSSSQPSLTQSACASSAFHLPFINALACSPSSVPRVSSNFFPLASNRWKLYSRWSRSIPSTHSHAPSHRPTNPAAESACSPAAYRMPTSFTSTLPRRASSRQKVSRSSSPNRNPAAALSWSTPDSTLPLPPTRRR